MSNQIKGFLETSFIDWPGKIVSVVFLPWCNFRCPYCHNHDLVLNPEKYNTIPTEYIFRRLDEFRGWIDGVCITGGEPTLHPYLSELIRNFKTKGFLIKLDTNGTSPDALGDLLSKGLIDYVSMDVKSPLDEVRYSRCAGVPVNLSNVRESIALLKEGTVPYEFRVTIVPNLLKEGDIIELAKQLIGVDKLTIQNFNPSNPLNPKLKNVKPYNEEELKGLRSKVSKIFNTHRPAEAKPSYG